MSLPLSPSTAFPSILGSPMAPMGFAASSESMPVMSGSMNWEPVRQRLLGPDLADALEAATELREGIEIVHTVEFPLMLSALLPAFSTLLAHRTIPSPDTSTVEHKLRNVVLEIISRMPTNEILRPHAPHLVAVALEILNRDYEENALLASRIILDLYKAYRTLPQDHVQAYLDFVLNSYRALPASVKGNFSFTALEVVPFSSSSGSELKNSKEGNEEAQLGKEEEETQAQEGMEEEAPPPPTTPGSLAVDEASVSTPLASGTTVLSPSMSRIPDTPTPTLSPRSNASFRVLTECPLVVMLMFQLYPKFLRSNIAGLISVMMEALALRAPPIPSIQQGNQPLSAGANRVYLSRCRELVAAQAKTLSFLTYLLRGFSNDLKPYEDRLATNVVALMSTCPREFISTRKELLVATRHLLNSEFRNGFFRHVDALLDERVLMGSHHRYSEQAVLRPLGYTTLSDLVHHVRNQLSLDQISKVVSVFSRVLHDSSMILPMSTQYTAVRTLLSLVDMVFNNKDRDPQIGRDVLVRILETLVDKLDSLHACYVLAQSKVAKESKDEEANWEPVGLLMIAQLDLPVGCDAKESLRDLKSIVRAIVVGHKTLIWHINKYRGQREKEKTQSLKPGTNEEVASAMLKITHTEQGLIDRYLQLAFPCMTWLKEDNPIEKSNTGDHYRDALSYFAASFTVLDGCDLRRTIGQRLEDLVNAVTEDATVLVVPRHLLAANATTSFEFCTILLNFLVTRMNRLTISIDKTVHFLPPSEDDGLRDVDRVMSWKADVMLMAQRKKRSVAHLQLFERILKSLSTFPENERALRPHLKQIVSTCLQTCMEQTDFTVDNHCMLLRYVFRSISAGKFEESYKELLSLIPTVLNGLFRIFRATDDHHLRHTIIELLLTIPARLSSLLPHMNLLLRVIIAALESDSGDLVNLGLRTLEFWVDNLNPDFLFPEITKQSDLFVSLMKSLASHLRPAPYTYGLLTLRLLGKLGGKNRRVLREPMDMTNPAAVEEFVKELRVSCCWVSNTTTEGDTVTDSFPFGKSFALPLSIYRCIQVIKQLISLPDISDGSNEPTDGSALRWSDYDQLWDACIEDINFLPYCDDVMRSTQKLQAESALVLLKTALNDMMSVESFNLDSLTPVVQVSQAPPKESDVHDVSALLNMHDHDFRRVSYGLMLSCCIQGISCESKPFVKGMLANVFLLVVSHESCFVRIDANGSDVRLHSTRDVGEESACDIFEDVLGSLKPFGYFGRSGCLKYAANPLVVNGALAELLADASEKVQHVALELLEYAMNLATTVACESELSDFPEKIHRGCLIFYEHLLGALCEKCIAMKWGRRDGIYRAICTVLSKMGAKWSLKYEIEVINVALISLKSVPREMSMASMKTFEFVVQVCGLLYGEFATPDNGVVVDAFLSKPPAKDDVPGLDSALEPGSKDPAPPEVVSRESKVPVETPDFTLQTGESEELSKPYPDAEVSATQQGRENDFEQQKDNKNEDNRSDAIVPTCPCQDVVHILIIEMASTNQLLRYASRYILKHFMIDVLLPEIAIESLKEHMTLIKRVLFSRSLRLLPLPEQVGAVEALAMLVDQLPGLVPLNDQHLLAFLSELLKMSSVADGEMTDPNLIGSVVDKNGYAMPVYDTTQAANKEPSGKNNEKAASTVFMRRDSILLVGSSKFFVPGDASNGVQLRASTIRLLRAVIRGHADPFFDAESSTPVGNIRPHVISLLFRSLVSFPLECVNVAHDALRDVLSLSVVFEDGKSKSRLRKELLQTCIRPVLLNLRDYTRLSVRLLRGLSRLLALLSSWFNKTLGEKLLDHLQKWTDPNLIRSQHIWREGTETEVAVAIIDLFVLLPHASHFVEPLVKTTIKLEACLPLLQANYSSSPYRKPLSRYLNKHCQYTVSFFLQRLKTPLYNEIFQDIITYPESKPLREFLTGRQSSVSLLNVCFERPLAIIRSEKAAASALSPGVSPPKVSSTMNTSELFHVHGIHPLTVSPTQKEATLKQDVDAKRKKLHGLQQELNRAKDFLHSRTGTNAAPTSEIEEAKRKHRMAKLAFDRGTKEFNESRQRYSTEVAENKVSQTLPDPDTGKTRRMTIEALELQHQGFRLIKTLIGNDADYFKNNTDVLRAFRWLWRSKGRYLRLQNEDAVPPRYHYESKLLSMILVEYSENSPSDVDLLFELIRIFLQPSSCDFAFVRAALARAVTNLTIDQKGQVMHRFFALLSGESTEEIKTLSIQLVVRPMLQTSFQEASATTFLTPDVPERFVSEVLCIKGGQGSYGERLKVELLKMADLFLEFVPQYLQEHGDNVAKFCLALVRSEDSLCKSWAYLVLCRHISMMETTPKLVLQVYGALTRLHQPEGKEIIRAGLDLLVPAIERRLSDADKKKAIEFTNRVMFEEVNSIPQLAHIWSTVVSHPSTFYCNRSHIVRYMINSLTRLGLPPNAPAENRALAVSVVALVLDWHNTQMSDQLCDYADAGNDDNKRHVMNVEIGGHIEKKLKTTDGPLATPNKEHLAKARSLLDQTMVDTLINFVVRLKLLLGEPKLDAVVLPITERVDSLLTQIASQWKQSNIRTIYLDRIVSMCIEFNKTQSLPDKHESSSTEAVKSKASSKAKSAPGAQSPGGKGEESKQLSASVLCACLDVFATLGDVAPENSFLTDNPSQLSEILASCFYFARKTEEESIRAKLKRFVVHILTTDCNVGRMEPTVIRKINVFIERALIFSQQECKNVRSADNNYLDPSRQGSPRSRTMSAEDDTSDDVVASFTLEILKEVNHTNKAHFKPFTSALLALLSSAVRRHSMAASAKQKQGGVSSTPQGGTSTTRSMHHTPTSGILAECASSIPNPASRSSQQRESFPLSCLKEFDGTLRTSVLILEILGSSDIVQSFTTSRKIYLQTLSTIFDSSNSLQLLMVSTRIVGRWLADPLGGPLTTKERNGFLWKMASFDYNGLPDVVSQPLSDLVGRYFMTIFQKKSSRESKPEIGRDTASRRLSVSDHQLIRRSLTACLLNANAPLREQLVRHDLSAVGDRIKHQVETSVPNTKHYQRHPADVLWRLIQDDFEGLGGRNWLVVFVEILLENTSCRWIEDDRLLDEFRFGTHRLVALSSSASNSKPLLYDLSTVLEWNIFAKSMEETQGDLKSGGREIRRSLSLLAHADAEAARSLFLVLLPEAWETIPSDAVRFEMIASFELLLSRSFNSQFLKNGSGGSSTKVFNVVKTFLEGVALLKPMPVLDVDLMVSLAESYSCWYEVLSILEEQFAVLSSKPLSKAGAALHDRLLLAMRHCYIQLGESNMQTSLALISCDLPQSHRAASFAIHGEVDQALETYSALVELIESREDTIPSDFEMQFIEDGWVRLQREQCQIAVVSDYASSTKNPHLMLESAWKQRDWDVVRGLCGSPSLVAAVESGEASVKICETLLAVANGKLSDVENLHAQTAQLCLYKWQLLPSFSHASPVHSSLLHFFHRLVEIRESGQIMVETSNHSIGKTLPDLKNLLNAWRHRLPNDYEELGMWDEIFTWRSHMFNAITSNFSWSEPSTLATLHDRPWSSIRMAMTARKQNMRQTSLLLLSRISDASSMDVSDAYLKLREQILAYNNPDSEVERTGGLNLINSSNLLYFDASQMSELFRLKAVFLSSLRRTSKSNQAYCHSVQICPRHSKAWISWGGLCSSLGTLTEKSAEQAASTGGSTSESSKDAQAAAAKKVSQYLAQAMGCYLEAVQIETTEKARIHLPKCLWMLTKDVGPSPGLLCQTLESRGVKLAPWVWLPWIPQLLTGLCRTEGRTIKSILSRVVKAYPQSVYYSLRVFYLERRDVERAKGVPALSSQHMASVAYAEDMMSTLRRSHASLWSSLEAILEELIVKFRPSYEEELLATISALLERAESHAEKQSIPDEARAEDEGSMVASWSKTLSRIAAKFFRSTESTSAPTKRDERVKKTSEFKRKYKDEFENDFKVNSADLQDAPSSPDAKPQFKLFEYIARLQKWKAKLEAQVACTPRFLPLIESSHALAMFAAESPDLWPGACDTKFVAAASHTSHEVEEERPQSTTSSSAAIARKAALNASLSAASAAAREGIGGEYGGGSSSIEIPGQYCPNSTTTADVKPFPELHAKLQRFEPYVEVLRRNGQLVRRVGMVGSDGRVYRFLLQFALPYWTRTDERTSQTNFIIDKFLRQNNITARNFLSIQPSAAIPVAQRLRITMDVESRVALDDVIRSGFDTSGKMLETIPDFFVKEVEAKLARQSPTDTSQEEREKLEKIIRREVYSDVCASRVGSKVFLQYIQERLQDSESFYQFRRAFAGQLASNSLLQYIFSVAERTPTRFVMILSKAIVLSPDFRVSYSAQGFIEGQEIPFRMTPNIEALIGKPYIEGRFIRSIAMVAGAIREHREELDPVLRLLMRDDILAWYSKSLAKTDSKTQELEHQLIERVSKNVSLVHARFSECAPTSTKAAKEGAIDSKIKELFELAKSTEKLSMMPTNYHAWL